MAASYTWHPRADWVDPKWPIPQSLIADELLSSFLVRSALAHGCSPLTLTSVVWPTQRVWTRDLDRGLSQDSLDVLSRLVGISVVALKSSTLKTVSDCVVRNVSEHPAAWPWVLVLGCRNRRHAGGLQCCPVCMGEQNPFYRIQGRLAWHTRCSVHRVRLIDCCPTCSVPLQPSLLRPGDSIARCHACKSPLAFNGQGDVRKGAAAFQEYVDDIVWTGAWYGAWHLSCCEWLGVTKGMLGLVRSASRKNSRMLTSFCDAMGVDDGALEQDPLGLPFEYLPVFERERLLEAVWPIMRAGPERFLDAASALLPPSALRPFSKDAPQLLELIMPRLPSHHRKHDRMVAMPGYRKPQAVLRDWLRLIRKIRRDGL